MGHISAADVRAAKDQLERLALVAKREAPTRHLALVRLCELVLPLYWQEKTGRNDNALIYAVMKDRLRLPWCAGWAMAMAELVGFDLSPLGGFWQARSVDTIGKRAMRRGLFAGRRWAPEPGDLILYSSRAGSDVMTRPSAADVFQHVGVVRSVEPRLGAVPHILSIEGNFRDDLRPRQTALGAAKIGGFVRLPEPA